MRPDLSLYVAGLSGALWKVFPTANQPVFDFYVFLRPVDVSVLNSRVSGVYTTLPSESIRARSIVTSVASVRHHSLFFHEFPRLHRPLPLSLLPTWHHMTPFSRPILRLCCPKRYTNGTEPHKNRPRKKRR